MSSTNNFYNIWLGQDNMYKERERGGGGLNKFHTSCIPYIFFYCRQY